MFFLPHPAKEQAKILWKDGAAVGFYSIKMKGEGHMACEVEGGVGIPDVCPSLQTHLSTTLCGLFWLRKPSQRSRIYVRISVSLLLGSQEEQCVPTRVNNGRD